MKAFPVCFVPTTGKPRGEHGNYGPMVLSALEYISRLYGVHIFHDQVYWSGIPDGTHSTTYTQYWLGKEFKLDNSNGTFSGYLNGKKLFSCTAGVRVVTDLNGTVREVVGIDSSKRTNHSGDAGDDIPARANRAQSGSDACRQGPGIEQIRAVH